MLQSGLPGSVDSSRRAHHGPGLQVESPRKFSGLRLSERSVLGERRDQRTKPPLDQRWRF